MKILQNSKVLVIPDIHQNLKFANKILSKHENEVDKIVFLGDYFDCFETPDNETYFGIKEVCLWLNEKHQQLGDKAIWLMGNHDLSYLASYIPNSYQIRKNSFYSCSGYSKSKAAEISKNLSPEFVLNLELCCEVNGYTLSHAGFHYDHFLPLSSEKDNIKRLYEEWENDKTSFYHQAFHWIGHVGGCRSGLHDVGSPVWLDWNCEFIEIPEVPQIVGHTNGPTHRQKGKSYCIDAYRSTYCILEPNKTQPDFYTVHAEPKKQVIPQCPICKTSRNMIEHEDGKYYCHGTHRRDD